MRLSLALTALAVVAQPCAEAAAASHHKTAAASAEAKVTVTVTAKAVLRAEPSEIGKVVGKVRPKEKLTYLGKSDDGAFVQVRRGHLQAWLKAEEVEGLPSAESTAVAGGDTGKEPTAVAPPPPPPPPPQVVVVAPPPPPVEVLPPLPPVIPPKVIKVAAPPLALAGPWASIAGGMALLGSHFTSTFKSGLNPDLFNYDVANLAAFAAQVRVGYTFGYRWLRVGVDAGYRFAGGTQIVVKLPEKDSLPNASGQTTVLGAEIQDLNATSHDADAAFSIGGLLPVGRYLDVSLRARGGLQIQALLPDFNPNAALPQQVFYGPLVGGVVEVQSRFLPGFGLRVEGSYIPYGVLSENLGLRDVVAAAAPSAECMAASPPAGRCNNTGNAAGSSSGYAVGVAAAYRVVRGFDVELGYRILSLDTTFPADTVSERLAFNRDPAVAAQAATATIPLANQARFLSADRATSQQTLFVGIAFRR